MPRTLIRPNKEELTALAAFIRIASITPTNRWRAIAVEAWAQGKTTREAATEANAMFSASGEKARGSQAAVSRAIRAYRLHGIEAFRTKGPAARGRTPVPPARAAAVIATLEQALRAGRVPTYAEVAKQAGVSVATVSRLAKAKRLDPKARRGRVAGAGLGSAPPGDTTSPVPSPTISGHTKAPTQNHHG